MSQITRRAALGTAGAFAAFTTALAPWKAIGASKADNNKSPPEMSAEERMAYHLAEFKKAAQEHDPSIRWWAATDKLLSSSQQLAFAMNGYRAVCPYDGDGAYYAASDLTGFHPVKAEAYRWTPKVHVKKLEERSPDGTQLFMVTDDHSRPWGDKERHGAPTQRIVTQDQLESVLYVKERNA